MFTPKLVYEQLSEKDAVKINCALVLDPSHVLLGAEDGLLLLDVTASEDNMVLKLGERKVTHLERCESMIVYMGMKLFCTLIVSYHTVLVNVGQRNRCPCFVHASLLGPKQDLDVGSVKVGDARSCQLISMGMSGNALCLCTTNRKKVSVFELNPKKLQYSKLKVVN